MARSSLSTLHERYTVQAEWTEELRTRLLSKISLPRAPLILEVGSGTGCITAWMAQKLSIRLFGIDIDFPTVRFAQAMDRNNGYAQADGAALPFPDDCFDLTFCHFLLLWTQAPVKILQEMKRCTKDQGWVIAFAEPDYDARIDYPGGLEPLGRLQEEALQQQGAETRRGRQLRSLFASTALENIRAGLLGGEWADSPSVDVASEWSVMRSDLHGRISPQELDRLEALDRDAWENQERILFVPTFYALAQKGVS